MLGDDLLRRPKRIHRSRHPAINSRLQQHLLNLTHRRTIRQRTPHMQLKAHADDSTPSTSPNSKDSASSDQIPGRAQTAPQQYSVTTPASDGQNHSPAPTNDQHVRAKNLPTHPQPLSKRADSATNRTRPLAHDGPGPSLRRSFAQPASRDRRRPMPPAQRHVPQAPQRFRALLRRCVRPGPAARAMRAARPLPAPANPGRSPGNGLISSPLEQHVIKDLLRGEHRRPTRAFADKRGLEPLERLSDPSDVTVRRPLDKLSGDNPLEDGTHLVKLSGPFQRRSRDDDALVRDRRHQRSMQLTKRLRELPSATAPVVDEPLHDAGRGQVHLDDRVRTVLH